jgi:hypothetical protein
LKLARAPLRGRPPLAPAAPLWHPEMVGDAVMATPGELRGHGVVESYYLAGGTALALRFGHRRSVDLDFFSQAGVDPEALIQRLLGFEEFAVLAKGDGTLHVTIRGVKLSFLAYPYPVLFPLAALHGVAVADPRDIACMKLTAIASRATKRDFVDLYEAAKQLGGLRAILDLFSKKYAAANHSRPHLLKSLTYFNDAEAEPMPAMLVPTDWAAMTRYFIREVPQLL